MLAYINRHYKLIIVAVLVLQCINIIYWGTRKESYFTDELYTLEGAKDGGIGCQYWDLEEDFYNNFHTAQEFRDNMTIYKEDLLVNEGSRLIEALQNKDPYYVLVNFASFFGPKRFYTWPAIGVNMLCFVLTQILIFRLIRNLSDSNVLALITIMLYGVTTGAVGTVLYARCYMLLTMLFYLNIVVVMNLVNSERVGRKILMALLVVIVGLISFKVHQFGIIMLGSSLLGLLVYCIYKKDKKTAICSFGLYFGLTIIMLPFVFNLYHKIFSTNLTGLFIGNSTYWAGYFTDVPKYLDTMGNNLFGNAVILGGVCIIEVGAYVKKVFVKKKADKEMILVMASVAFCGILLVGKAIAWRYTTVPTALVMVTLIYITWMLCRESYKKWIPTSLIIVCMVFIVSNYIQGNVPEQYRGHNEVANKVSDEYGSLNAIFIHAQGAGENWLYDSALLWPDDSQVYCVMVDGSEKKGFYDAVQDDEILLWLTCDYDDQMMIEQFEEITDYNVIEKVVDEDTVSAYLCHKNINM